MDLEELVSCGLEPTAVHVGAFTLDYLSRNGPSRRTDILDAFDKQWASVGGLPLKSALVNKFKHATQRAFNDRLKSVGHGVWGLVSDEEYQAREKPAPKEPVVEPVVAEREIGSGKELVYCYYLDVYRQVAELRGESVFPVKIGMTLNDLRQRMNNHRTASPEPPRIALVLWTSNASLLEKAIHSVLDIRGKRMKGGGTEWFVTNPDEIAEIYEFLANRE